MAKDSQGLAFSPYKDDAQRVAQTNDDIISQKSAKDENGNFDAEKFAKGFIYGLFGSKETAEQGNKIEQTEAKQEAVKGEGWTMKDGGEAKTDYVIKTDLAPNVRDLSKITTDEISADLEYLAGKHPEIFDKPSDVFRLVKDIKENPTHFFTNNRLDYALIVKRLKNNKIGKLAIDKQSGEVKHATKVKDKDLKRLAKVSEEKSGNAGIIQTFTRPGSKLENQGLGYQDEAIISQKGNLVNEKEANELKSLSKEYDVEQFLKDREGILAKDARYGKTRFSESRIEDNGGVGGWEYKRTPAGYDKNYKADFLITKADVAKIRGGKIDEQTLGKLKQDLESSEYLGYEYKKTHKNNGADEYADEEFFKGAPVESKGGHSAAAAIEEQRFAGTGRDKTTIMYANPHVGAGLASGTLNAKDENGNFDAEKFAKGFIYGLFGSKVTVEQGSKLEQAEAKQEAVKGEGWTMKDGGEAKQYAEHKFEVEKWINDLSGVLSDEWIANLKSLALKHPEMFRSEANVFRVIKEIKDNPTHFFKNNRDDAALIAKELKDEKAGNIVIKKDDGRIVHVNKTRKSNIARLQRNNEKALEGTPTPSILDAEINPAQTRRFAATPNDEIISQKGNLVNEETKANGLRDSVSSIGDNASRTGGRQASDEQVEQQWAAKADGEADAAAAGEQVVEKQGSSANIGGGLAANSNAHLGSGLVAGSLNSIDEDGNFSPERFAAGFLAGLAGSKAAAVALRKAAPKLYENLTNTAKSFSDKGIKKIRGEIEKINGITPIKEFGENYAEFYHNGKGAVQKLLAEEQGQVAGAFYRDDLGDITLPWGEAGTGRSDGWGLAKIKRFHPEVMDRLDEIIRDGKFYLDEKGRPNIKLGDEIVGLKDNWLGKETPYWIVSSYDKSLKARPSEGINSARSKKAIGENFSSETGHETIISQNLDDAASNLPKPEDIIAKHPNVERELDESIAAMRKESFNDSNFKAGLMGKFDTKEITTQELGKSVNLSDKQLAVLKNDIKNADFKVINESKIYFDKIGKDGDKKRFFVDIAEDGSLRVDAYAKSQVDNIPVKQSALEELAGTGDAARLKNMSFEVKAAYRNELDPIKKEAILKTAELNKLKKAAQSGDKAAVAKFEEFKAKNLDENGNIKDGLSLC